MFFRNKYIIGVVILLLIAGISVYLLKNSSVEKFVRDVSDNSNFIEEDQGGPDIKPHPLSIQALKEGEYPGSDIVIEQTLTSGSSYQRYIVSYRSCELIALSLKTDCKSEGLKIYGLLTVPNGNPPSGGFPAIIFNHGYISPSVYKTTEKYVAYQDAFARVGYITFKSDYRGHGK